MKLLKLRLKNFRSYCEKNSKEGITFRSGINLLVGENNAGKSNLLKALDLLKGETPLTPNDYYGGIENEKEVYLELEVEFTSRERKAILASIMGNLNVGITKTEKIQDNLRRAEFSYSSKTGPMVRIMQLYVKEAEARLDSDFSKDNYTIVDWKQILDAYFSSPDSSVLKVARTELEKVKGPARIRFNRNVGGDIYQLFRQELKIFSEVRQRPGGKNANTLESYDGSLVADVLATLKMGSRQQRKNFESIKKEFNSLFPTLQLEVIHEAPDQPPKIVIEKTTTEYEVPIDRVGAGIGEMVILLTHLIASKDMVFGLDMPELHFHPHSQRLLLDILRQRSLNNQILIITHSPILVQSKEIGNIMVAREQKGETVVTQLPDFYFSADERNRLERNLTGYNSEFFFSRASLIVEGPTEMGAMPIFSRALETDFDKYGVSMVQTGKHFDIMMKLLDGLKFPYVVMSDKDCLLNIEGSIKINKRKVKTSPLFYNLEKIDVLKRKHKMRISKLESEISTGTSADKCARYKDDLFGELSEMARTYGIHVLSSDFEGVLGKNGYTSLLEKAGQESESKPTCGRLVAQEIVRQNKKIPDEFVQVINDVIKKAESR
jgi:predicted ATP-dependent endonuclease of OLD family